MLRKMKRISSLSGLDGLNRTTSLFEKIKPVHKMSVRDKGLGLQSPIPGKLLIAILIPFAPVYFYAFYHLFDAYIALGYGLLVTLYFLGFSAYVATEISIRPPWYKPTPPEFGLTNEGLPDYWQGIVHDPMYDFGLEYEDVEFKSYRPEDAGLTLRGWYVPGLDPDNTLGVGIIFVHGGGRDRRAWLRHVPIFYNMGVPSLLFDLREHGISDGSGRGFTYGVKEKFDVISAMYWMCREKQLRKVILVGTSVGGASVIMATHEFIRNELRKGVLGPVNPIVGVVAENPVANHARFITDHIATIVDAYCPNYLMPAVRLFMKMAQFIFLLRIGIPLSQIVNNRKAYYPIHIVQELAGIPFFIMHGTADEVVPIHHGMQLFENAKEPKFCWWAKDVWHCALHDKYPEEFKKRMQEFIEFVLHREKGALSNKNE